MKLIKLCSLLFLVLGIMSAARADTQIGGSAVTDSSFTMTGLVSISTLTANNISVSTMAAERALISGGSSVSPSLAFSNEQNTGFYRPAASLLGLTQSGNLKWTFGSEISSQNSATIIRNAFGSSGAPSYTFAGNENTGMYRDSTNVIGLVSSGTVIATIGTNFSINSGRLQILDGSASSPGMVFSNDTDSGLYRIGSNTIGLSVAGTGVTQWLQSGFHPVADNTYQCGASNVRWSSVWAVNGTIQTSSSKQKREIRELIESKGKWLLARLDSSKNNASPASLAKDTAIQIPRAIMFKWKAKEGKADDKDVIGIMGDDLPIEARAILNDGSRDPENFYSSSVVALLCAKVRQQDDLIKKLIARVDTLEARSK